MNPGQYVRHYDYGIGVILTVTPAADMTAAVQASYPGDWAMVEWTLPRRGLDKVNVPVSTLEQSGRWWVRTAYHVWSIMDRQTGSSALSIGARGIGDAAAKAKAEVECARLNRMHDDYCARLAR